MHLNTSFGRLVVFNMRIYSGGLSGIFVAMALNESPNVCKASTLGLYPLGGAELVVGETVYQMIATGADTPGMARPSGIMNAVRSYLRNWNLYSVGFSEAYGNRGKVRLVLRAISPNVGLLNAFQSEMSSVVSH